jgi:hypothetical protein
MHERSEHLIWSLYTYVYNIVIRIYHGEDVPAVKPNKGWYSKQDLPGERGRSNKKRGGEIVQGDAAIR